MSGEKRGREGEGEEEEEVGEGLPSWSLDDTESYLTPLQQSLVHELTTRREKIAAAKSRAAFWHKYSTEQRNDRFPAGVLSEEDLDRLIKQRKADLLKVQQANQLKKVIMQAADSAHVINTNMAATEPLKPGEKSWNLPLSHHSLRHMTARRDELALEFLRTDTELKAVRSRRRETSERITAIRGQTAILIADVCKRTDGIANRQRSGVQGTSKQSEQHRKLTEALQIARGKREMVKGALRGIILESGLDWYGNRQLRELMLELGDEPLDSSEDEPDFDSDEELESD